METRPCEETTRPSFGEHAEGFNGNYKSKKNYLIVKKIKARIEAVPWNNFFKEMLKSPSILRNFGDINIK